MRLLALTVTPFIVAGACVELSPGFVCCRSEPDDARMQAYEIAKSCEVFRLNAHRLPRSLDELTDPAPPLDALLEALPRDPWGHAYGYVVPGLRNDRAFDVVSAGPDGVFYTDDDLGNWPR